MLDIIQRHAYRVARNFVALIFIQMTIDFLIGPIGYVVGISRHGWYALAPWQIKMMFTSPIQNITEFVFMATLLLVIWEITRTFFLMSHIVIKRQWAMLTGHSNRKSRI